MEGTADGIPVGDQLGILDGSEVGRTVGKEEAATVGEDVGESQKSSVIQGCKHLGTHTSEESPPTLKYCSAVHEQIISSISPA